MFRLALNNLRPASIENDIVALLAQNLIAHPLSPAVQAQKCQLTSEEHEDTPAELVDVRTRACTKQPTRLFLRGLSYERLMLEQHVVFESHGTKASEDTIAHEVVRIGSETINNIVVVPDIHHWNLAVGHTE